MTEYGSLRFCERCESVLAKQDDRLCCDCVETQTKASILGALVAINDSLLRVLAKLESLCPEPDR